MPISAAFLSGIGSVASAIGGLFGKKAKAPTLDLAKLRADAKRNGFNPLTVLRLTGGGGFHTGGQVAQPSVLSQVGLGIGSIGNIMQASEDREIATREAEARIASMETLSSQRTASTVRPPNTYTGRRIAPVTTKIEEDKSPFFGKDVSEIPYHEVRAMNGQTYRVRADVLHSLGRKPGDTLITEDYEALTGEIGGEMHGLSSVIDDGLGVGEPWMITTGGRTAAEKTADRANPSHTATPDGAIVPVKPMKVEIDPIDQENTLFEDDPWMREWQD